MEYIEHPKLKALKAGNEVWEEWNDCKILQRHFCKSQKSKDELEVADAAVFLARDKHNKIQWHFAHVWLADKEEVSDGEAEEIGEVMSSFATIIHFCPYCGVDLNTEKDEV